MTDKAHATPEKDFFITMITKDITLDACVMDLLDNAVDGATATKRRRAGRTGKHKPVSDYSGFTVSLTLKKDRFEISDNCGGIKISDARDYAFHFGRRRDVQPTRDLIGTYGIGMKRAIFKLGQQISIRSTAPDGSFLVDIDVPKWSLAPDWDFDLKAVAAAEEEGTAIKIHSLNSGVGEELEDSIFRSHLVATIGQTYAMFIEKGLVIKVDGKAVSPFDFSLRQGTSFKPVRMRYKDKVGTVAVTVELWAGLGGLPPDDSSPDAKLSDVEQFGWFAQCNNRTVVRGDKSDRTVWGDEKFPAWHPQYNGFVGVVTFNSEQPRILPWTTTKTDIDVSDPLYRRAVVKMKEATRPFIDYTQRRKGNIEEAKKLERQAKPRSLLKVPKRPVMVLPRIEANKPNFVNILYQKPIAQVRRVAAALGDREMPAKTVGTKTFEYYLRNEVGE